MSLVPIIQPPLMRLLTRPPKGASAWSTRPDLFPIWRASSSDFGYPYRRSVGAGRDTIDQQLMLGNLLRESGVVDRLNKAAK